MANRNYGHVAGRLQAIVPVKERERSFILRRLILSVIYVRFTMDGGGFGSVRGFFGHCI